MTDDNRALINQMLQNIEARRQRRPPRPEDNPEHQRELLKEARKRARKEGRCIAPISKTEVCGAIAVREKRCRMHYNKEVLKILHDGRPGAGRKRRPFAYWQLPGSMTDAQHDCLRVLPVATPYEACLTAMNAADPTNPLSPIYQRPTARKPKA